MESGQVQEQGGEVRKLEPIFGDVTGLVRDAAQFLTDGEPLEELPALPDDIDTLAEHLLSVAHGDDAQSSTIELLARTIQRAAELLPTREVSA